MLRLVNRSGADLQDAGDVIYIRCIVAVSLSDQLNHAAQNGRSGLGHAKDDQLRVRQREHQSDGISKRRVGVGNGQKAETLVCNVSGNLILK